MCETGGICLCKRPKSKASASPEYSRKARNTLLKINPADMRTGSEILRWPNFDVLSCPFSHYHETTIAAIIIVRLLHRRSILLVVELITAEIPQP